VDLLCFDSYKIDNIEIIAEKSRSAFRIGPCEGLRLTRPGKPGKLCRATLEISAKVHRNTSLRNFMWLVRTAKETQSNPGVTMTIYSLPLGFLNRSAVEVVLLRI